MYFVGFSTNYLHYQVFLVEGLLRWNADRKKDAEERKTQMRCYNIKMMTMLNTMHQQVFHTPAVNVDPPQVYTGRYLLLFSNFLTLNKCPFFQKLF